MGMEITPLEWLALASIGTLASVGLALVVAVSFCF